MTKSKSAPVVPSNPVPTEAPTTPTVWRADNGKWYHCDESGTEYGPFFSKAAADDSLRDCVDELEGRRPLIPPKVMSLLQEIWALEDHIANVEDALKNTKALLKVKSESDLVELLTERELTNGVRTEDGRQIVFERVMHCSVAKPDKSAAFAYLQSVGAGALLKRSISVSIGNNSELVGTMLADCIRKLLPQYEVSVRVGKAPEALVGAIQQLVVDGGLTAEVTTDLELAGSTLRSWVTKQMKLGIPVPDVFGVYAPMKGTVLSAEDVKPSAQPSTEDQ